MIMKTIVNSCSDGLSMPRRKKIWELRPNLHCSICGTCLSIEEQRQILKKMKLPEKDYRDYEIHAMVANNLFRENMVSCMTNAYLDKKYRVEIARFGFLEEAKLMMIWRDKMTEGDICGLYWAVLTNPALPEESINRVVGEVHMLLHLNGGLCRQERMKLKQLAEEKQRYVARLQQSRTREKEVSAELDAARICIAKLERQVQEQKVRNRSSEEGRDYRQMLDSLKSENDELRLKLEELNRKCQDYREESRHFLRDNDELEKQVRQQKETIIQLCRETKLMARCQAIDSTVSAGGEAGEIKKKRLLLVGGNSGLNNHYRDLINGMGWEFRHHDGCLNGGRQSLTEMLKWSDLILCSLDANSHGAVHCVKELAPKLHKEYRLLGNSSLSGISRALAEQSDTCTA